MISLPRRRRWNNDSVEEEEGTTKAILGSQGGANASTHKQEAMSNEHLRTNKGDSGIYRHFPATFLLPGRRALLRRFLERAFVFSSDICSAPGTARVWRPHHSTALFSLTLLVAETTHHIVTSFFATSIAVDRHCNFPFGRALRVSLDCLPVTFSQTRRTWAAFVSVPTNGDWATLLLSQNDSKIHWILNSLER
jgi:hypothetical protein